MRVLTILRLEEGHGWQVRFTPEGEQIAMCRSDGQIMLFQLQDVLSMAADKPCDIKDIAPREVFRLDVTGRIIGFTVDQDLVVVRYDPELDPYGGHRVEVWNLARRALVQEFIEPNTEDVMRPSDHGPYGREWPYFRGHVLCGRGRFLVSGSADGNLYIYDLQGKDRLIRKTDCYSVIAGWYEHPRYCAGTAWGRLDVSHDVGGIVDSVAFSGNLGPDDSAEQISIGGKRGAVIVSVNNVCPWNSDSLFPYSIAHAILDTSAIPRSKDQFAPLEMRRLEPSESEEPYMRVEVLDDSAALSWNEDGRMSVWDLTRNELVSSCKMRDWESISSIDIRRVDPKIVAIAVEDIGLMLFDVGSSMEKGEQELLRNRFGVEIEESNTGDGGPAMG